MMAAGSDPIFIGGLSHSGKTELRQILETHPELSMTRRTSLWNRFYLRFGDLGRIENLERCLSVVLEDQAVNQLRVDPEAIRKDFVEGKASYARLFGLLHSHHARASGKRRWGDQLKSVELFAEPIFEEFPEARMIHMVRDPRDRFAEATTRVRDRRRGALGSETAIWLRSAVLAGRNQSRYPGKYLVVHYEDLAASTVDVIERICRFLGERTTQSMRDAARSIAFQPTGIHRAGKSRRVHLTETSPEDAFVSRYAGHRLSALGYPVATDRLSPTRNLSFLLVDWPLNRATMAWRLSTGRTSVGRVRSNGQ